MPKMPLELAFYTPNIQEDPDVIEGVARGGQLVVLAGSFSVGKSPLLQDLAVSLVHGIPWCGRKVQARPVVYFDLENPEIALRHNTIAICDRHGVEYPRIPEDIEPYYLHGKHSESGHAKLAALLQQKNINDIIAFLEEVLSRKPNAVVMMDPVEMLFKIDTIRKVPVLEMFSGLRGLLTQYGDSIIVNTFNLRKKDGKADPPDLLRNPRGWLEEVCGSLDLINRSDVRLGVDFYGEEEDQRLINGARRGETFDPIFIKPVGVPGKLAGFELCSHKETDLLSSLTVKQRKLWEQLPEWFRFDDIADKVIPHSTLFRLLDRLKSLGLVEKVDHGLWRKTANIKQKGVKLFKD